MSEVLARILVREAHGIRRFLYPLTFPDYRLSQENHKLYRDSRDSLSLCTLDGTPVPFDAIGNHLCFAVSLGPFQEQEFLLQTNGPRMTVDDALDVNVEDDAIQSRQRRFAMTYTADGNVQRVVYDGISHLRSPATLTYNNKAAAGFEITNIDRKPSSFFVNTQASYGHFESVEQLAFITTETTACKSWLKINGGIDGANPDDEIVFTLPLAITSSTLTCDFGVGGYVFGKMDVNAPEIVWHTEFGDAPYAKWTVATAGRVDYVGEVSSAEAFLPQRWFHLIDSDKALAVAITMLPDTCRAMTVRLTLAGDTTIAFKLGGFPDVVAAFGVCYHFLNNVPAIAAATNPQSILLPPSVEVLPTA